MKKYLKYILVQLIIVFLIIEVGLRISGVMKVYSEKTGYGYLSYYNQKMNGWYHTRRPNSIVEINQPEFSHTFNTNQYGFRDKEWKIEKEDGMKRLIVFGDSYTEGDGVEQEYSFPSVLERKLNKSNPKWEVFNAGVNGSDPFFYYKFLKYEIAKYQPDFILMMVNYSDFRDYIYRGGLDRFSAVDTTTVNRKGPWWEPFYKYSHTFRIPARIFFTRELTPKYRVDEYYLESIDSITSILRKSEIITNHFGADFIAVTHPEAYFLYYDGEKYMDLLRKSMQQYGTPYVCIYENMKTAFQNLDKEEYMWPINAHFNEFGYKKMAYAVYDEIMKHYPDFFKITASPQLSEIDGF